jgi:DNA-binding transcriptional LysR family regulator
MTDAQLEALVAVADARSVTSAARQLGLTQSAVSHSLAGLERALRVTLIERTAGGTSLTSVGHRIAAHARQALRLKAMIAEEAEAARKLQRGTLRVGSFGVSATRRLLPPLLDAFARRHPGISLLVTEGTDDEVAQWIRDGSVDAGFVTLPADEFETVLLAEDEFLAIMSEDHPLAMEQQVTPRQLGEHPFIMSLGGCEVLVREAVRGVPLDVSYRIREVDTIVAMAARGVGISLMPHLALPDALPHGLVTRPLSPTMPRQVAVAARRNMELSHVGRAFLRVASAERLAARQVIGEAQMKGA